VDVAKPKTYFEQVPLVVVKEIAEEEELKRDTNNERRGIEIPRVAKTTSRRNSRGRPRKVA
jgi:hypothetical protein